MTTPSKRKGDACACGCGERTSARPAKYVRGHRPPISLAEAVARHTLVTDGCWEWQGYIRPSGYGDVGVPGESRTEGAHRASWLIHEGPIPDGMFVCHHCDNPRCVRPDHLFLGTSQDNMDDMWAKGRGSRLYGSRSPGAKLTLAEVEEIRRRHVAGIHPARRTGGSSTELAREFGITRQYVGQLVSGSWRTVA